MKTKVTIQDIADAVGSSKTTVSRYLNGRTNMMSAETASRIKSVIELLDYHPSELARSLKTKKTYTVGIVVSDISTEFESSMVAGIGEVLEENGYFPLFINSHQDIKEEKKAIGSLISKGVDGLIVNTTSPESDYLYEHLKKGVPVVLCNRKLHNINMDFVGENKEQIMESLVKHLKEEGYSKVAFFSSLDSKDFASIQPNHFVKAMQDIYNCDATGDTFQVEAENIGRLELILEQFLETVPEGEIPAIIGADTISTISLHILLKKKSYQLPETIGLCGVNAWHWRETLKLMKMLRTSITCVKIDGYDLGATCAKQMIYKIENPQSKAKDIKVEFKLEIGESTKRS